MTLRPSATSRRKARAKLREPGRDIWKRVRGGVCMVCGQRGVVLRHHVVYEQHVRNEGGEPWDLANAMDVGLRCRCHSKHHQSGPGRAPIPVEKIPDAAIDFAIALLGYDRAAMYFARYYDAGDATNLRR